MGFFLVGGIFFGRWEFFLVGGIFFSVIERWNFFFRDGGVELVVGVRVRLLF